MGESKRRKLSREATVGEIFPGRHGPVQLEAGQLMRAILEACRDAFPNYGVTVFLSELDVPDGAGRLARFNYASSIERPDMVALLRAFIAKNEEAAAIDAAIGAEPPTRARQ